VVDAHCDTVQKMLEPSFDFSIAHERGHVDLPRLRAGGVTGQVFAAWVSPDVEPEATVASAREQLATIVSATQRHADDLVLARRAADVRAAQEAGKVAAVLAIEGGHLIANSLDHLEAFAHAGAVYLTLTHAQHNDWADSAGIDEPLAPKHNGLTDFGREIIRAMNRLGMIVDVSHVSEKTVRDVLETSDAPVIASHSSCHAVSPHCRNLSDDLLRAIAECGGVVHINFAALFIDPAPAPMTYEDHATWWCDEDVAARLQTECTTTLALLVDHFDHALQVVGPAHVGFGSDFDGVPALPVGMESCAFLPRITAELLRRGYAEDDLRPMLGENFLRVLEACQASG
jgi:membrane dipeptidase